MEFTRLVSGVEIASINEISITLGSLTLIKRKGHDLYIIELTEDHVRDIESLEAKFSSIITKSIATLPCIFVRQDSEPESSRCTEIHVSICLSTYMYILDGSINWNMDGIYARPTIMFDLMVKNLSGEIKIKARKISFINTKPYSRRLM